MATKPVPSYLAILVSDRDNGGYSVCFPDLPGCVTQGDDFADAQAMASDALSAWLASMVAHGDAVPLQRTLEAIQADKTFAREYGVNWGDAIAALIAVRPALGRPERVNVSLDSNKLRAIDAYAERRGLTRSAVLEAGAELLLASDPMPARRPAPSEKPVSQRKQGRKPHK